MPGTLGRGRQGREDGEPLREVGDGFRMGGALDGVLPRLVPIPDRLGIETRFRAVMRQEFGLGGRGLGKLRLQHRGPRADGTLAGCCATATHTQYRGSARV